MQQQNRREFLVTSSMALAGLGLGASHTGTLLALPANSKLPVYSHMPDLISADSLRSLATLAMEVADAAGAHYSDIRIGDRRRMTMELWNGPQGSLHYNYSYGIRVLVGGVWSFVHGADPTREGVVRAVQEAVSTAKSMQSIIGNTLSLPPVPVARGEWSTSVQIDPFDVSPDEHAYMCGAYASVGTRVRDGNAVLRLDWTRETRVFASTEGALTTQILRTAKPESAGFGRDIFDVKAVLPFVKVKPQSAGFEIVAGAELQEELKLVTEEAVRLLSYPVGEIDVGRYEAVIDGLSVGSVLDYTLLRALDLDRALGNQADEEGTSFLMPDGSTLGQQRFSPLLTFRSDRTPPQFGAAKWDDEGVEVEPCELVQKGRVLDFIGMRSHVNSLADWYAKNNKPIRPHGSAIAWVPEREPICSAPSVVVDHNVNDITLDDLIGDISNGVVVRSVGRVSSDQQLTGGLMHPDMLFEVKKGKITRRLMNGKIQFKTEPLLKSLDTLGGESTIEYCANDHRIGQPWSRATHVITSPAARFSEVDVTRLPQYTTSSSGYFTI